MGPVDAKGFVHQNRHIGGHALGARVCPELEGLAVLIRERQLLADLEDVEEKRKKEEEEEEEEDVNGGKEKRG